MKKAIIEIICASHFVRASSFWQLQFIPFLEQVEYCNYLLILEGVLFRRKLKLLIIGVVLLGLRKGFSWQLYGHSLLPFGLGRLLYLAAPFIIYTPFAFGGRWFKLFNRFSAISACSTSSFQVWAFTAPIWISNWSRKLCLHVCNSIGSGILAGHIRDKFLNRSI